HFGSVGIMVNSTRFALLGQPLDSTEIGSAYPQIQRRGEGSFWELDVTSQSKRMQRARVTGTPVDLGVLRLERQARLCDRLSCTPLGLGLLLSRRAAEVFRRHKLGAHVFCPVKIAVESETHSFEWLEVSWFDDERERPEEDLRAYYEGLPDPI